MWKTGLPVMGDKTHFVRPGHILWSDFQKHISLAFHTFDLLPNKLFKIWLISLITLLQLQMFKMPWKFWHIFWERRLQRLKHQLLWRFKLQKWFCNLCVSKSKVLHIRLYLNYKIAEWYNRERFVGLIHIKKIFTASKKALPITTISSHILCNLAELSANLV